MVDGDSSDQQASKSLVFARGEGHDSMRIQGNDGLLFDAMYGTCGRSLAALSLWTALYRQ